MGSSLSDLVGSYLQQFLEVGPSSGTLGLNTSYRAGTSKLRPQRLSGGLLLTGDIGLISVSTQTLRAVGALVSSAAPPVRAEVSGVRLRIEPDPSVGALEGATVGRSSSSANAEIEGQLSRLELELRDFSVTCLLGGHALCFRFDVVTATPMPTKVGVASWKVEHSGVRAELDGRPFAWLSDGPGALVHLRAPPFTTSAKVSSSMKVSLDVGQVLALVDVDAAAKAARSSLGDADRSTPVAPSTDGRRPWSVTFPEVFAQVYLSQFFRDGEPFLELLCRQGKASGAPSGAVELAFLPLAVRAGGPGRGPRGPRVSDVRVRFAPGKTTTSQRGGPDDQPGELPVVPLRSAMDVALSLAPPTPPYSAWLGEALGNTRPQAQPHSQPRTCEQSPATAARGVVPPPRSKL